MAEEVFPGVVGDGKDNVAKKTIITILIFAFGIMLFLGGVQLGKIVQYGITEERVIYFEENCVCSPSEELNPPSLGFWNVSMG